MLHMRLEEELRKSLEEEELRKSLEEEELRKSLEEEELRKSLEKEELRKSLEERGAPTGSGPLLHARRRVCRRQGRCAEPSQGGAAAAGR